MVTISVLDSPSPSRKGHATSPTISSGSSVTISPPDTALPSRVGSSPPEMDITSISSSTQQKRAPQLRIETEDLDCVARAVQNAKFFPDSDYCQFLVGGQLFQVDAKLFRLQSREARALIARQVERPDGVIIIDEEDIDAVDFERFLTALHCNISQDIGFSTGNEWVSVLKLSLRYNFASMGRLALARLSLITDPIEKIILAHKYGPPEWLEEAYMDICEQDSLPSDEEVRRLGLDTFIKVTRAREAVRRPGKLFNAEARKRVIRNVLGLPRVVTERAEPILDKDDDIDQPTPVGRIRPIVISKAHLQPSRGSHRHRPTLSLDISSSSRYRRPIEPNRETLDNRHSLDVSSFTDAAKNRKNVRFT